MILKNKSRYDVLVLFAIFIAVIVCYYAAFESNFINRDDGILVVYNPNIREINFENLLNIFTPGLSRVYQPITDISYAIDYAFWELDPFGYHLSNVVLFFLACSAFYFLLNVILKRPVLSGVIALVVAVHPINSEMVMWVSGRKDTLGFLFFTLTLLFYLKIPKDASLKSFFIPFITFIFMILSKINYIILIPLLGIVDFSKNQCRMDDFKKTIFSKKYMIFYGALIISALIGYYYTKLNFSDQNIMMTLGKTSFWGNFLSLFQVFSRMHTMFFCLTPISPINYIKSPLYNNFEIAIVIFGGILVLSYLCFAIYGVLKSKPYGFWLSWLLLGYLPHVFFVIFNQPVRFEARYLYLPNIGFYVLLCLFLSYVLKSKLSQWVGSILFILIVFSFSWRTIYGNQFWKNKEVFWSRIAELYELTIPLQCLGEIYLYQGELEKAQHYLERSLRCYPKNPFALAGLGMVYVEKDDLQRAMPYFNAALEIRPNWPNVRIGLAEYYLKSGDRENALIEIAKVEAGLVQWHRADILLNRLGSAYFKLELFDKARIAFTQALEIRPDEINYKKNLAQVYFSTGEYKPAKNLYLEFVQDGMGDPVDYNNLALIYLQDNDPGSALRYFEMAYEENAAYEPTKKNMDMLLQDYGDTLLRAIDL